MERLLFRAEEASSEAARAELPVFDSVGVSGGGDDDDDVDDSSGSEVTGGGGTPGVRGAARGCAVTLTREEVRPGGACVTVSERVFLRAGGAELAASGTSTSSLSSSTDFLLALPLLRGPAIVRMREWLPESENLRQTQNFIETYIQCAH